MQELSHDQKETLVEAMISYYAYCRINNIDCIPMCSFITQFIGNELNELIFLHEIENLFPEFCNERYNTYIHWFRPFEPEPRLKFSIELKERLIKQK